MPIKVVPSLPENPEILEKNNYIKFLLSVKWQKKGIWIPAEEKI
jgi:hypothetical protein